MADHQLSEPDLRTLLQGARALAEQAAQAIMAVYQRDFAIQEKADESPLTEADLAAHRLLERGLRELEPRFPVLSEESTERIFEDRRRWRRYWLIDPLDGTKEFCARNGEFTVNVALIEQGEPILGVIHLPVTGESCFAARGVGAWRVRQGKQEAIAVSELASPIRIALSRSHSKGESQDYSALGAHTLVPLGSSLKFNALAAGEVDLYPRLRPSSCEWDIAAGQCIVEQAGGAIVDRFGARLRYNQSATLLVPAFVAYGKPARAWTELLPWSE